MTEKYPRSTHDTRESIRPASHEVDQRSEPAHEKTTRVGEEQRKERGPREEDVLREARREATPIAHEREKNEPLKSEGQREEYDTVVPRAKREAALQSTLREIRTHMSTPAQAFSAAIHNPTVERVSEVAGKTVARPNAILSGSIFSCISILAVYLIARQYGYALSGAETIVSFAAGWIIGIIYDFTKSMITGGKSH